MNTINLFALLSSFISYFSSASKKTRNSFRIIDNIHADYALHLHRHCQVKGLNLIFFGAVLYLPTLLAINSILIH
jgi:hypothetical protein